MNTKKTKSQLTEIEKFCLDAYLINKDADTALQQIDLKNYPERFARCGLPIVKVGINFDREKHTIGDWRIA